MLFPSSFDATSNQKKGTTTEKENNPTGKPLRTANLNIFPSLNPLGSFYKERNAILSQQIHQPEQPEPEQPELSKKQKLNNGEEKRSRKKSETPLKVDKDGFCIPRLPKKCDFKTHKKFYLEDREDSPSSFPTQAEEEDGFKMPKNLLKDIKETRINFSTLNKNKIKGKETSQTKKKRETQRKPQASRKSKGKSQQEELTLPNYESLFQATYPGFVQSLYEQLRMDCYSAIVKQNIELLSYAYQPQFQPQPQPQTQYSPNPYQNNYSPAYGANYYLDLASADTDEDEDNDIKVEYMKQEIEC